MNRVLRAATRQLQFGVVAVLLVAAGLGIAAERATLESVWDTPPQDARLRAYWWWLNGNVTKEAITRDLEEMKAKGFGGALICDADGSSQDGNARAPHGPTFFSPAWRELYKHTLREADRLGLEMSLNIQSGWNLGGPMVAAEDAPKKLVWTETKVSGGAAFAGKLDLPKVRENFYRDLFVLAYRQNPNRPAARKPLQNQQQKALIAPLTPFSAPDSTPLFQEVPATTNEQDTVVGDVLDLTAKFKSDGSLDWIAPPGEWQVLRFGFTLNDHCRVSTCSEGWDGYALDPFDAGAFKRYWDAVVAPLIADAGPLAGKTLKYLHTDSWEVEVANWTPTLLAEFKQRRGYELLPWLPVIAGKIVNSREESNRFLHDFRRTMGDLAIANHYQLFRDRAHQHGLLIHPESGGPHAVPIDAQQCLGFDDAPMSEFWAWSWRHRIGDANRFFVKQPASAAHAYGRKLVLAEGFTTIGPHWQETLWDNLKPSFDHACTEGLNLLVWHAFVCSPASEGMPGQQYFAGTHLNPNVTWWEKSAPFFAYINRCQALLQAGLPVADVAYYYGDHVPNFTQHKLTDPAKVLPGYDYDVVTSEVILERMSVKDGRLVLPDGLSYRVLVLADREVISLPVLRKLKELVAAGATVIGPKPKRAEGLKNFPQCDAEVAAIADELWGKEPRRRANHQFGKGRIIAGRDGVDVEVSPGVARKGGSVFRQVPARDVLRGDGVVEDFALGRPPGQPLDYFHRRTADADIYFVANRTNVAVGSMAFFRVADRAPEFWDPVSGKRWFAASYESKFGRCELPLELPPYGSMFVVFREPAVKHPRTAADNRPRIEPLAEFAGPWTVHFPIGWSADEQDAAKLALSSTRSVVFDSLVSWTARPEPGIKFYSGVATYTKTFEWKSEARNAESEVWLDLGSVRELAEVRVNGQSCGIVWAPPFRVNISKAVQPGTNSLAVDVVNFWPNRIIGDAALPEVQRRTKTNIRKLTKDTPLIESGLFGPVRILRVAP